MSASMLARGATMSLRAAGDEARYWGRALMDRPSRERHAAPAVVGDYLVTTDRGVFLYRDDAIRQVSKIPAFGIAIADDRSLYLASWNACHTSILVSSAADLLEGRRPTWREIWRLQVAGFNARVHQISVAGDSLWLANTAQNCLTRLDRLTGTWKATVAPFLCRYGLPIQSDHNHVNGVLATAKFVVFSAFKINRESAFGVFGDGRLWLFRYRNMGVHDCAFDGGSFFFCDSYSFWDSHEHGFALRDNMPVAADAFARANMQFVRGIAGTLGEIVVGNSFTGDRTRRFAGRGSLLVLRADGSNDVVEMPAAQIYDIVRTDGRHFEAPPNFASATEVAAHFQRMFGDPIDTMELTDVLSGPNVKTFDARDHGEISDYLDVANPTASTATAG